MSDTDKWLFDLINELMEYTYSYAKGDIAMTENPPLLLARKTQQAIKDHIAKERTQAAIEALTSLELPTDENVTTKYGYHSDEKKYGYRLGVTDCRAKLTAAVEELRT